MASVVVGSPSDRRRYTYDRKADAIQLETFTVFGEKVLVTDPLHGDVGNVKTLDRLKLLRRSFALQ